jgi:hypothetical protein
LIGAVSVVALSSFALATTDVMYVEYANVSPGITTDLSGTFDGVQETYGPGTVYTGVYNLTNDPTRATGQGVTISNDLGSSIPAFCMDVLQDAPNNFAQYQVITLDSGAIGGANTAMGTTRANEIRELFGRFYSQSFTNTQAAAFQAAIWEIEYEAANNPLDVNSGSVVVAQSNPAVQTVADGWLGSLTGNPSYYDNNVRAIGNGTYQDYVFTTSTTNPGVFPVPEPLTITAVVMALGGLGMYVRKRTKTTAVPARAPK